MRNTLPALLLIALQATAQPRIENCPVFPNNNIWNVRVDGLSLHPRSAEYVNSIGRDLGLRNDFGSGLWNGAPIGIPYVLVGATTPRSTVTFEYDDESDHTGYPIPPNPPIEGGPQSTGDRHVIMIDTSTCTLHELYRVDSGAAGWSAGSGAVFDLNSNTLRPATWTSADAAGLPIFPGLVRYEEVAAGAIRHMVRFTVPKTSRAYLWPSRHYASSITDPAYPPMGVVMRLRSTFDLSTLEPQARMIAQALKTYGMILADNGSAWFLSGIPDERWNMDDLYTLRRIKGSDFEAVDLSPLMVNVNSAEARTSASNVRGQHHSQAVSCRARGTTIEIDFDGAGGFDTRPEIAVVDVLGAAVALDTSRISTFGASISIDLADVPAGTYFVYAGVRNVFAVMILDSEGYVYVSVRQ